MKNQTNRKLFIRNVLQKAAMNEISLNECFMDLATTFIQAGVSLQKLSHPVMKSFLEKYTKFSVPDKITLRKKLCQDNL